ncbi:hypothetical protein [Burkholderia cenocepacia]|uniref:Uncharacterized protein n=1 Tax=Burkholderia cenocepacia TaxID=95486 RepID=A0A3S9NDG9_9BURK|nr:hypothetical protein [Burkholderia cenocepacia]AZQ53776.1 hypothetical protein D5R55_23015 [Burkholderia cenocepacia]
MRGSLDVWLSIREASVNESALQNLRLRTPLTQQNVTLARDPLVSDLMPPDFAGLGVRGAQSRSERDAGALLFSPNPRLENPSSRATVVGRSLTDNANGFGKKSRSYWRGIVRQFEHTGSDWRQEIAMKGSSFDTHPAAVNVIRLKVAWPLCPESSHAKYVALCDRSGSAAEVRRSAPARADRPRKTLNFDTPAERFHQAVASTG